MVLAQARWPEPGDGPPPPLPGFVHSTFAPLVAAVAGRCLERRPHPAPADARCAVVLVSAAGDRPSAVHVRSTVAAGGRVGPLFFFQSVPNSVAGQVAARWGLDGPVVCLSPTGDPRADATAEAELLLYDGDADEALLVLIEQAPDATPTGAVAVLLAGGDSQ
ncbi:beta-ketoacyl synthase chain length factor [Micromonospora sp. NPDC051925]|uniref:beta-ketoacyl synthase chain length factor n=1 Tax=Micromonospora sp. NPDC051925 TaxID=3364288 RepID=UPI0037C5375D